MLYIYQNAQAVRAWVGREYEECDKTLRGEIEFHANAQADARYNLRVNSKWIWDIGRLLNTFGTATVLKDPQMATFLTLITPFCQS